MARNRSIAGPITLTTVAVVLMCALIVGWSLLWASDSINTWLFLFGAIVVGFVIFIVLLFGVSLAVRIVEIRRQNYFIDSVTHELKSPLASLKLCLEGLSRKNISGEQRSELQAMMASDVQRLTTFIDDIIESNRLDALRGGSVLETVELESFLGQCCDKVSALATAGRVVTVSIDEPVHVTTDSTLLQIAVKNLIDNACKYTDSNGKIEVSARPLNESQVEIVIKDDGIGIGQSDLKKVSRRFYRGNTEAVRSRHGTGLGLYVVANAIRRLGGRLELSSDGLGKGTTVKVILDRRIPGAENKTDLQELKEVASGQ